MFLGIFAHERRTSEADRQPWRIPDAWSPDGGGSGRVEAFGPPAGTNATAQDPDQRPGRLF